MAPHLAPPPPAPDDAPRVAPDFARPVFERQLAGLAQVSEIGLRILGRLDRASARYEAAVEAAHGVAQAAAPAVEDVATDATEPDDDDDDQLDDDLRAVVAHIAAVESAAAAVAANGDAPHSLPVVETATSLAFTRASRTLHQTYAQEAEVIERLRRVADIEEADADDARCAAIARGRAHKDRIGRIVTRIVAEQTDGDTEAFTRLCKDAGDRLSDVEVFGDLLDVPVSDTVARVCRDLGLDPDWPGLVEESWAREELRSGRVGQALKTLLARDPDADPLPPPRRRIRVPRVVIPAPPPPPGLSATPPLPKPIIRILRPGATEPEPWPGPAAPSPSQSPSPAEPHLVAAPEPEPEPVPDPPPPAPPPPAWVPPHEGPHILPGELPPPRGARQPRGAYYGPGGFMG